MRRILFAWELGGGLGHVNRLCAIAAALAKAGAEPVFVTAGHDAMAKAAARILPAAPVIPVRPWGNLRDRNPSATPTHTLADILWLMGGDSPERMAARLGFWRQQIARWKPSLIVADSAPMALAAAAGRIPTIAVGNAFSIPPLLPALADDPALLDRALELALVDRADPSRWHRPGGRAGQAGERFPGRHRSVGPRIDVARAAATGAMALDGDRCTSGAPPPGAGDGSRSTSACPGCRNPTGLC